MIDIFKNFTLACKIKYNSYSFLSFFDFGFTSELEDSLGIVVRLSALASWDDSEIIQNTIQNHLESESPKRPFKKCATQKKFWTPPSPCHSLSSFFFDPPLVTFARVTNSQLKKSRNMMWTLSPIFAEMSIFSTQNVISRWTTTSNRQWNGDD